MGMKHLAVMAGLAFGFTTAGANAATVTFDGLGGVNQSKFSTYSEAGFNISNEVGQFFVGKVLGDPAPDIFAGPFYGPANDSIQIVRSGGGDFTFGSVDLAANGGASSYTISGFLNGSQVFTSTSTFDFGNATFGTITNPFATQNIDSLSIALAIDGTSANIDNIGLTVSSVPLPASAPMFGTALLGLAGLGYAAKRKKAATAA